LSRSASFCNLALYFLSLRFYFSRSAFSASASKDARRSPVFYRLLS
jgi:hypothetical protein